MPEPMKYPVYINSKGRATRQLTARALLDIGITPTLVVEDAEHDAYAAANPQCRIIVWPDWLWAEYDKTPGMDPHPTTGVGRNAAWVDAMERGFTKHWIMDDNIRRFRILNHGQLQTVATTTPFHWHEQLSDKYVNLGGLCLSQSAFIVKPTYRLVLNTRLYCAMLMTNEMWDTGIRWRRGYNEDTITSIDILKTGYWCTIQSYVMSIDKIGTSRKGRLDGGMTQFYANGGFVRKAAELQRVHPDCCRITQRYMRVHHWCNYKMFTQQLIPRAAVDTATPNN